jgi:hypothetical protein
MTDDQEATCKRCLKIAPFGTDLTVTPGGTKLLPGYSAPETSAPAEQICVCGMMPGHTYHKRHCPAQEARGIYDVPIEPKTSVPEESSESARVTVVACDECGIMPHDLHCSTGIEQEQARTGIHAACGMPLAAHCAYCDPCPLPSEKCGCGDDDLVSMTAGVLATVVRGYPKRKASKGRGNRKWR